MIRLKTVTSSDDSYLNKKHSMLVIGVFKNQKLNSTQNQLNKKLDDLIINTIKLEGFKGECDQSLMCYGGDSFQNKASFGNSTYNKVIEVSVDNISKFIFLIIKVFIVKY